MFTRAPVSSGACIEGVTQSGIDLGTASSAGYMDRHQWHHQNCRLVARASKMLNGSYINSTDANSLPVD